MSKSRSVLNPCSAVRALDQIGDGWSLLIVREAMLGSRRFSDFQSQLGIARNILVDRLSRLVDYGVLKKVNVAESGTRYEYRLTTKGHDLFTVMVALRQWGELWCQEDGEASNPLRDRLTGQPLPRVQACDMAGNPVTILDVFVTDAVEQDAS